MAIINVVAPLAVSMHLDALDQLRPHFTVQHKTRLARLLEFRAPVAAAQIACNRAGEAQQGPDSEQDPERDNVSHWDPVPSDGWVCEDCGILIDSYPCWHCLEIDESETWGESDDF